MTSILRARLWPVAVVALACRAEPTPPAAGPVASSSAALAPPSATAEAPLAPPVIAFAGLVPWKPPVEGAAPVTPPATLLTAWRAMVNQAQPRQRKNPPWQALPHDKAVTLEFAEPGPFRCLVNPLEIQPLPNEENTAVATWLLIRRLRCSSDGWRSWSELPHAVLVRPDGTETRPVEQSELFLRHRAGAKEVETIVWLRSDERRTRPPPPESEE